MENKRLPVVIDTDAYNEIDDQFAIAYLMRSEDQLETLAIYAAPFYNNRASSPADGMEKSYQEILRLMKLMGNDTVPVLRGSENYLPDEQTPVISDAAKDLARRAMDYTPENPLIVLAIGCFTNVASALLLNAAIADRIKVIMLGGHAQHWGGSCADFNMRQDIAAARVIFRMVDQLVQLPCFGVISHLTMGKAEMEWWLRGKNALCDYLIDAAIEEAESYAAGQPWTRVIWDVSAVAWLLNGPTRMLDGRKQPRPMPGYDQKYDDSVKGKNFIYVYGCHRDAIFADMFRKLERNP